MASVSPLPLQHSSPLAVTGSQQQDLDMKKLIAKLNVNIIEVLKRQMHLRISIVGGINQDKLLNNIMNYCMSITLARQFCWKGRDAKGNRCALRRFDDSELCGVIKGAVRLVYKECTDDYFKIKISNYLDLSKDARKK